MEDRLVLLGTKGGPSLHVASRMPTASLLVIGGQVCVVDCGLGVTRSVVAAGVKLAEIDRVYITHLHSDHVLELGPLVHTAWTCGRTRPLPVFGPAGTGAAMDAFFESMRFDIELRIEDEGRNDIRALVEITEYSEGPVHGGDPEVAALRVLHPPVTDCFALRFDTDGWRVTFSSDTRKFPPLVEFARGSDLLVHEAMLAEGIETLVARTPNASRLREHLIASHTVVEDAVEIAAAAEVRRLALHHLVPSDGPGAEPAAWQAAVKGKLGGQVFVGEDGMEFTRSSG